jgi:hypothetical protein
MCVVPLSSKKSAQQPAQAATTNDQADLLKQCDQRGQGSDPPAPIKFAELPFPLNNHLAQSCSIR